MSYNNLKNNKLSALILIITLIGAINLVSSEEQTCISNITLINWEEQDLSNVCDHTLINNIELVKDLSKIEQERIHNLLLSMNPSFNLTIINAENVTINNGLLKGNFPSLNISACETTNCSIILDNGFYLLQKIEYENNEIITTKAKIDGKGTIQKNVDEGLDYIFQEDDTLIITEQIYGFTVLNKNYEFISQGNNLNGTLIITKNKIIADNAQLFIADNYLLIGNFSVEKEENALTQVNLKPTEYGRQSHIINMFSELNIQTTGHELAFFFSKNQYDSSNNNKVYINELERGYEILMEGKGKISFFDNTRPEWFSIIGRSEKDTLDYVLINNTLMMNLTGTTLMESGTDENFIGWNGKQESNFFMIIDDLETKFLELSSLNQEKNKEIGELKVGVYTLGKTHYVRYKIISGENTEINLKTNTNDLQRLAETQKEDHNIGLLTSDIIIKGTSGNKAIAKDNSVIFYVLDQDMTPGVLKDEYISANIIPYHELVNTPKHAITEEEQYLFHLTNILTEHLNNENYDEVIRYLKEFLEKNAENPNSYLDLELMTLQALYDSISLKREKEKHNTPLFMARDEVASFIKETYNNELKRDVFLIALLVSTSTYEDLPEPEFPDLQTITEAPASTTYVHTNPRINEPQSTNVITGNQNIEEVQRIILNNPILKDFFIQDYENNLDLNIISEKIGQIIIEDLASETNAKQLLKTLFESTALINPILDEYVPNYASTHNHKKTYTWEVDSYRSLIALEEIIIEIQSEESFTIDRYTDTISSDKILYANKLAEIYVYEKKIGSALIVIAELENSLKNNIANYDAFIETLPEFHEEYGFENKHIHNTHIDEMKELKEGLNEMYNLIAVNGINMIQLELIAGQENIELAMQNREGTFSKLSQGDLSAIFSVGMGKDIYSAIGGYNSIKKEAQKLDEETQKVYQGSYVISVLLSQGVPRAKIKSWLLDEDVKTEDVASYLMIRSGAVQFKEEPLQESVERIHSDFGSDSYLVTTSNGASYRFKDKTEDGIDSKIVFEFLEEEKSLAQYTYKSSTYTSDFRRLLQDTVHSPGEYILGHSLLLERDYFREIVKSKIEPGTGEKILSFADDIILNPFDVVLITATLGSSKVATAVRAIDLTATKVLSKIPVVGRAITWGFKGNALRRTATHIGGGLLIGSTAEFIPEKNQATYALKHIIYRIGVYNTNAKEVQMLRRALSSAISSDEIVVDAATRRSSIQKIKTLDSNSVLDLGNNDLALERFLTENGLNRYTDNFKNFVDAHYQNEINLRIHALGGETGVKKLLGGNANIVDGRLYYKGNLIKRNTDLRHALNDARNPLVNDNLANTRRSIQEARATSPRSERTLSIITGCVVRCNNRPLNLGDNLFVKRTSGEISVGEVVSIDPQSKIVTTRMSLPNGQIGIKKIALNDLRTINEYRPNEKVAVRFSHNNDIISGYGFVKGVSPDGNTVRVTGKFKELNGREIALDFSVQDLNKLNNRIIVNNNKGIIQSAFNNLKNLAKQGGDMLHASANLRNNVQNKAVRNFQGRDITQRNSIYANRLARSLAAQRQGAVKNKFYRLAWTHNTDFDSFVSILANKELRHPPNVGNYLRYGVDNHYGDIVIVFKRDVEKLTPSRRGTHNLIDDSSVEDFFSVAQQRYPGESMNKDELLNKIAQDTGLRSGITEKNIIHSSSLNPQLHVQENIPLSRQTIEGILVPAHLYDRAVDAARQHGVDSELLIKVKTGSYAEYTVGGAYASGRFDRQVYDLKATHGFYRTPAYGGKPTQGGIMHAGPDGYKKMEQAYFELIGHSKAYAMFYKIEVPNTHITKQYHIPDTEISLEPGVREAFAWSESQGLTFGVTGGGFRRSRLGFGKEVIQKSDLDIVIPDDATLRQQGHTIHSYISEIATIIARIRGESVDFITANIEVVGRNKMLDYNHYSSPSITLDKVVISSDRTITPPPSRIVQRATQTNVQGTTSRVIREQVPTTRGIQQIEYTLIWTKDSYFDLIYPIARNVEGTSSQDYRQTLRALRTLTEYPGLPIDRATANELKIAGRKINELQITNHPINRKDNLLWSLGRSQLDKKVRKIFETSRDPQMSIQLLKDYGLYDSLRRAGYDFEAMARGDYYKGLYNVYNKFNDPVNGPDILRKLRDAQTRFGNDARNIPQAVVTSEGIYLSEFANRFR